MKLVPEEITRAVMARAHEDQTPATGETVAFVYDEALTYRAELEALVETHGYGEIMSELEAALPQNNHRIFCDTFADAVGAFVAREMTEAIKRPEATLDEESRKGSNAYFSGVGFDDHLRGYIADLIDLCSLKVTDQLAPCYLCIVGDREPTGVEYLRTMLGCVWIEQA